MFKLDCIASPFDSVMEAFRADLARKAEADRERTERLVRIATDAWAARAADFDRILHRRGGPT